MIGSCSVPGCGRDAICKGMCFRHYQADRTRERVFAVSVGDGALTFTLRFKAPPYPDPMVSACDLVARRLLRLGDDVALHGQVVIRAVGEGRSPTGQSSAVAS